MEVSEEKHTQELKDSVGLKKVEKRHKQFLLEKIIHDVEFKIRMKVQQKESLR